MNLKLPAKQMRKELDKILMDYIRKFEKKQDMNFEFAVCDDLMDVICFGCVYHFSINDIIFDIDTSQPKGLITEWLEGCLENNGKSINYQSYSKGLRFADVEVPNEKEQLLNHFANILLIQQRKPKLIAQPNSNDIAVYVSEILKQGEL